MYVLMLFLWHEMTKYFFIGQKDFFSKIIFDNILDFSKSTFNFAFKLKRIDMNTLFLVSALNFISIGIGYLHTLKHDKNEKTFIGNFIGNAADFL